MGFTFVTKKFVLLPYIPLSWMTQEVLLEMMNKKDPRAFNLMYDMYSKSLFSIISNIVKETSDAEDVLQETFIKIWKNAATYDTSKGRFYTWILNIARNTALDKVKSKSYNNTQKNLNSDNFVHLLEDSTNINARLDSIGINEFVKKLKPKCIQIIELLFYRGYTQQEVSDELEMPLGSVKTLNRSCISELRNYLKV
jgi:RNA polymerase sigma-70 factor, ECF subfamily